MIAGEWINNEEDEPTAVEEFSAALADAGEEFMRSVILQLVPAELCGTNDFEGYFVEHQIHLRVRLTLGICELWKDGRMVGKFRRRTVSECVILEWVGPNE